MTTPTLLLLLACADKPGAGGSSDPGDTDTESDTVTDTDTDTATGSPWATPCSALTAPVQTGAVVDASLDELSGVAVSRSQPDVLWVHEDHLGAAAVTALNPAGETLATVTLEGASNHDWEDIAVGTCGETSCIYIGEIGNNDGDRTELGVYVLAEPDLADIIDGAVTVTDWTWYGLAYPDVVENSEALAVSSGGLPVVLSKEYEGETSDVYRYPALDAVSDSPLIALGTLSTGEAGAGGGAAVTAADLWPDDSRMLVRTYARIYEVDLSDGLENLSSAPVTALTGASEMHGEAIAYDPWKGGFWQLAEGLNAAVWYTGCAE